MSSPSPAARLIPHLRRAVLASDTAGLTDGQLLGEFVRGRDEAAFAALVRRHGPMVLGVCRRVVGDAHAAEDAFQATFLVLARRAAAVRPREQVGNFLYGVAYRTALKTRAVRARRRAIEQQVHPMPHPEAKAPVDVWPDLHAIIDAELARLPDKYRLPVVLCDLEGRPQREVARQLGVPQATLACRLASARRTLAKRLTDRGVALSGGALAVALTANAADAAVPHALTSAAVRAAKLVAAGGAVAGAVPAHVVHLSEGVLRMMMLAKLKAAAAVAVVALIAVGGVGVGALPAKADDPPAAKADPAKPGLGPNLTDEEFLRRVCLDLRGDAPTRIEMGYFLDDKDAAKRKKVVGWLTDGEKQAAAASFRALWGDLDVGAGLHYRIAPIDLTTRDGVVWEQALLPWASKPAVADIDGDGYPDLYVAGRDSGDPAALALAKLLGVQSVPIAQPDTDDAFLRRVCQDARGTPPTRIELEYFAADPDPKKREKLVDLLLKDPAVAKKVGPGWKKKVLGTADRVLALRQLYRLRFREQPAGRADRVDALVGQLLDGKRTDDQVLDTLTAAVLGRLPTEGERAVALAGVAKAQDKRASWTDVAAALAATAEARRHAEDLTARTRPPEKK